MFLKSRFYYFIDVGDASKCGARGRCGDVCHIMSVILCRVMSVVLDSNAQYVQCTVYSERDRKKRRRESNICVISNNIQSTSVPGKTSLLLHQNSLLLNEKN